MEKNTKEEEEKMNRFFIIVLGLGIIFLTGCSNKSSYTDLSPIEFKNLIEDENVFVLDVHIPEQQHISTTDAFIPYNKLQNNIDKLPENKEMKIAVYCRSGSMSATASKELNELGYKNVYNLIGGRNAYVKEFGG